VKASVKGPKAEKMDLGGRAECNSSLKTGHVIGGRVGGEKLKLKELDSATGPGITFKSVVTSARGGILEGVNLRDRNLSSVKGQDKIGRRNPTAQGWGC